MLDKSSTGGVVMILGVHMPAHRNDRDSGAPQCFAGSCSLSLPGPCHLLLEGSPASLLRDDVARLLGYALVVGHPL